ncbi:MAG: hypothetical protein MZV63_58445 [Marinilabiliales bacterium]|nr:hypothetical protein [Marinilabiliales bacterium]
MDVAARTPTAGEYLCASNPGKLPLRSGVTDWPTISFDESRLKQLFSVFRTIGRRRRRRRQGRQARVKLVGHRDVGGGERRLDLRNTARADDGAAHRRVARHPGDGETHRRDPDLVRDGFQTLGRLVHPRRCVAPGVHGILGKSARAIRWRKTVFPGQQAAAQRVVGHHAHARVERQGEQLDLGLALDQVVHGLHDPDGAQAAQGAGAEGLGDLPRRPVADAQIPHLALLDQRVEGAQRFLDGDERVEPVGEVHVDPARVEPPQALLTLLDEMPPGQSVLVGALAHRPADLGGNDQPVALLGDDLAQDALRLSAGVNIGAVEKVDAGLAAAAVDGLARPAVGFLPERHGPQAKLRDHEPGGP